MAGRAGAVVVMDPRNGDVLAMVSTPAFDIDRFTGTVDRAAWLAVVKDPAHPLLNRTIQTQYAPGSVFKIIVAAAGLQEGTLTPMDRVQCTGAFHIGGVTFKDWKEGGHGGVDLLRAINQSCNVYFYHYGLKIGGAAIARYAAMFGSAPPRASGSAGRSRASSPSRGARGAAAVAAGSPAIPSTCRSGRVRSSSRPCRWLGSCPRWPTGESWRRPRVVQRVMKGSTVAWSDGGEVTGHVELSPMVWAFLRQSLWSVVNQGGTGAAARIPGLDVAGKTGTAQMIAKSRADKGEDHAWFASFAPARAPEVVVVVLVERGGKGGQVAAPIARKILNAIFLEKVASVDWAG